MKLLSFNHSGPHESDLKYKTGITGRRWSVYLEPYILECLHEIEVNGNYSSGGGYYILSLSPSWGLGYKDLGWYDGPHKCFSLGFLHFSWS